MHRTLFVCLWSSLSCFLLIPAASGQSNPTLDTEQSTFLTLINNYRAQNGAGPLQVSIALQNSSQWMSTDMAAKNYFSHTDSLGRDPFARMIVFGYNHATYEGENIAAGYSDAQNTFVQWQTACDANASGACTYAHRLNMLNAAYRVIGIGRVNNPSSTYRWYWTTDFGGFVDATLGSTPAGPVISSFTATPGSITAGQVVTLSWSVSGATSLTLDNGVGSVTGMTSHTVVPAVTTKYTLTASNTSGSATATVTVTVNPPGSPSPTISILPTAAAPTMYLNAGSPIELGLKFRSDQAGKITGVRFYKITNNTGVHTGSLWSATGQVLATGTFTNETASGWQTLQFASPVSIAANTTYVVSYHTNAGFSAVGTDLQTHGIDNAPLHALKSGVDGYNGVYWFGSGGHFPSQGTAGYNFWVDVMFTQ